MSKSLKHILPVIVFAQFAGTSLWFASNAVLDNLVDSAEGLANLTSAVQFGFISGTLLFAFANLADRFSPRKVFLASAILGAICNAMPAFFTTEDMFWLFASRFMTGFFLAGIYPVGMKIAADWYKEKLGKALGYLVGALVLGTAFPHLLNIDRFNLDWQQILYSVSVLAIFGAILLYVSVPEGPLRHRGSRFRMNALYIIFKNRDFRSAAFGYFGHMWELYAFWAFVPVILFEYQLLHFSTSFDGSLWSFLIIGSGSFGCVVGGVISLKKSSAKVAFACLLVSFLCCLLVCLFFNLPPILFLSFLLLWGIVVVGDSPQFSTLNAVTAPREWIGSALTIATCVGFSITIISIQFIRFLIDQFSIQSVLWILAIGPLLGLLETWRLVRANY